MNFDTASADSTLKCARMVLPWEGRPARMGDSECWTGLQRGARPWALRGDTDRVRGTLVPQAPPIIHILSTMLSEAPKTFVEFL